MGLPAVTGASVMCTMGLAPGTLVVTNQMTCLAEGKPVATINDSAGIVNITPCGMCTSMANPVVAAATAAALGVLTPQPCIPATVGAWICPGKVLVSNKPILTQDGKLICSYGGSISIINPGQTTLIV